MAAPAIPVFSCINKESTMVLFTNSFGGFKTGADPQQAQARTVRPDEDGDWRPSSRMLAAISSTRFCSRVERRISGRRRQRSGWSRFIMIDL